jgi:hypothetical protein
MLARISKTLKRDWQDSETRPWVWGFFAAAALRFASVVPFVIDDDEAWWVVAARALKTPWEYYFRAVDHKPPGIVWFYWLLNRVVDTHCDPRVIRAIYTLLLIPGAWLVGWIARELARPPGDPAAKAPARTGWIAGTLFLVGTSLGNPKVFSVTSDGVMLLFVIAGYALALRAPGARGPGRRGNALVAFASALAVGAILGCGLLVKQTGVFFALPILICSRPRRFSPREISLFALGSLAVVVPAIMAMDWREFIYWNWTYPRDVLVAVRERLIDTNIQFLLSVGLIAVPMFPVAFWTFAHRRGTGFWLRDFRALWLLSAIALMLMGKGLFLHYFIAMVPPLAMILAAEWPGGRVRQAGLRWVAACYALSAVIVAYEPSAIVWGTDLPYFRELGAVLKSSVPASGTVMVWGGSALPLAYSGLDYPTRFVLPRFAAAPYLTPATREIFHQELSLAPPYAILDIHERMDNRFNNTLATEPFVTELVRARYRPYVVPTIPWAKFYLREAPRPGSPLVAVTGSRWLGEVYRPFPRRDRSWRAFTDKNLPPGLGGFVSRIWSLRAEQSLELVERQGVDAATRAEARLLAGHLEHEGPGARAEITAFLDPLSPLPWRSFEWYGELGFMNLIPPGVPVTEDDAPTRVELSTISNLSRVRARP